MPSVSKAQAKFMKIAAKNPEFAKKAGISQTTAKEWSDKDSKERTAKLPARKGKASNETYTTTAVLTGPRGFKDQ